MKKIKEKFNKYQFLLILFVFLLIVVGAGYTGYFYASLKYLNNQDNASEIKEPEKEQNNELLNNADFTLYWEAVKILKNKHIDKKEIDDKNLLYGSIKGLLSSLDDPYTVFFTPSEAKKFEEDIQGVFGGIGAEIGIKKNQLIIVAPLKGNPAERVGLKAGDKIIKIDDKETFGLTLDEAVRLIRGEPGTDVNLLILRDGWEEAQEFNIKREIIIVPTLDWKILDNDILYLQLYSFNPNAEVLMYKAVLDGFVNHRVKGLILDLRNNPGGFLDVAVNLAGWFLERGSVVVKERFSDDRERIFYAYGNAALAKVPVVVLVNKGSASASEILASALRDLRDVKVIGEKTFGKGTVQEVENLKDGSVIKISVAEWLTPKGSKIDKVGITPDFEIEIKEEDLVHQRDSQLERAIEILISEMKR